MTKEFKLFVDPTQYLSRKDRRSMGRKYLNAIRKGYDVKVVYPKKEEPKKD